MTEFNQVYSRYGTYSTQWDFIQDRFGEKNLLPFSISDMDFKIPQGTQEVLKDVMDRGFFGYTRWNHEDFKGSIRYWFKEQFDVRIDEEWCVYSPSVIYSLSVCLQLLTKKEDRVITFTPCYDAFFATISQNDRKLVKCSLTYKKGEQYSIDFDNLEELIKNEKPTVFLLCNPHNPTGRVFTKEELLKIIQLCNKHEVAIISDEIHMDVRRKGMSHLPILSFLSEVKVPVVLLSSASKTFNTPGLGGSYCVIPDEELRSQFLNILKGRDGLSSIPYPGLLALQDCYRNQSDWVKELNEYVDESFNQVKKRLDENSKLSFVIPEATYLGWIDVSGLNISMDELQRKLIQEGKVAIMRGDTYGSEGEKFIRLNLGAPRSKVMDGVNRLMKIIESLD